MKKFLRYISLIVSALLVIGAVQVSGQDISKQKNKKAQLEKDIALLDKQIANIKKQSASATTQLELLRQNISNTPTVHHLLVYATLLLLQDLFSKLFF